MSKLGNSNSLWSFHALVLTFSPAVLGPWEVSSKSSLAGKLLCQNKMNEGSAKTVQRKAALFHKLFIDTNCETGSMLTTWIHGQIILTAMTNQQDKNKQLCGYDANFVTFIVKHFVAWSRWIWWLCNGFAVACNDTWQSMVLLENLNYINHCDILTIKCVAGNRWWW